MHAFASEVIEYIYAAQTSDKARREMVFSLYGNYSLLAQEVLEKNKNASLKQFITSKPYISDNLIKRLEPMIQKLIEKGHTRHTIVQSALLDYIECQEDEDKLSFLADLVKETFPALLASRDGLKVACALFNRLDAKDRKIVVKSLPVADMLVNRIAHLFIIHVINNLDDTQLSKKKILNEAIIKIDDYLDDSSYQTVLISALSPL